jgi:hypothetical protein
MAYRAVDKLDGASRYGTAGGAEGVEAFDFRDDRRVSREPAKEILEVKVRNGSYRVGQHF